MKTWMIIFVLVGGTIVYLAGSLWGALFIVSLDHDEDFCRQWHSSSDEDTMDCVAFKNTFEGLKYSHNLKTLDRNRYWIYSILALTMLASLFCFNLLPRSIRPDREGASVAGCLGIGFVTTILVPMVLSSTLPPPNSWFPEEIQRVANLRAEEAEISLMAEAIRRDLEAVGK